MNVFYQIKLPKETDKIHISIEFVAQTPIVSLFFSNWRPGRYQTHFFAKNILSLEMFDENNHNVVFEKQHSSFWKLETETGKKYRVEYKLDSTELNAGSTYHSEDFSVILPVNALLYSRHAIEEPCIIEVEDIQNREIVTTLKSKGKNRFFASNFHELADSPICLGKQLKKLKYLSYQTKFEIVFQGLTHFDTEKIISDFKAFTDYQYSVFGNFPFHSYKFYMVFKPEHFYHGVEHLNSSMIVLGPYFGLESERTDLPSNYYNFLSIASHELFHAWNIKSIRPAKMMPYDYQTENYTESTYFAEGITTYFGELILFRSGGFTEKQYFAELAKNFLHYFHSKTFVKFSLAESSSDVWLDGYDCVMPPKRFSIYSEGAIFSFMLDVELRKKTENMHSLNHVLKILYHRFAKQGKGYKTEDVIAICSELSGGDVALFFQNFLFGKVDYTSKIKESLNFLGLMFEEKYAKSGLTYLLGIKTQPAKEGVKIELIHPNSPLFSFGIRTGDFLLRINHNSNTSYFEEQLKYALKYGIGVLLHVEKNGKIVEIELKKLRKKKYFPEIKVRKKAHRSDREIHNFEMYR